MRRPTSIAARFRFATAIIGLTFVLFLAVTWWAIDSLANTLDAAIYEVDHEAVPLLALDREMRATGYLLAESLSGAPAADLDQQLASIDAQLAALTGPDAPALREENAALRQATMEWQAVVAALPRLRETGSGPGDLAAQQVYLQINSAADQFNQAHQIAMNDAYQRIADTKTIRTQALVVLVIGSLGLTSVGFVVVRREAHGLMHSLQILLRGARRVGDGELGEPVDLESIPTSEFVELGRALNSMAGDIQDRESRLTYRALHDPLTELGNRTMLDDRLSSALSRLRRNQQRSLALMFVDLDGFKKVNDTLGHSAGDEVIRMAAGRIGGCLRDGDTLARLGGDEFAIVAEDIGDASLALGERVVAALEQPFAVAGTEMTLGASIGLTQAIDGHESVEDLLRGADLAMYDAKRVGGNQVRRYQDSFRERAQHRINIEQALRVGLASNQLKVHYQPVWGLESNQLRGVEALVRWDHPEHGTLLPDEFIPIAEETGLIIPLGAEVLHQATRDFVRLTERQDLPAGFTLAVNASVRQLESGRFASDVLAELAASGMPPNRLILEITETELLAHSDIVRQQLDTLRTAGVQVALDDFGTGYTTLQYLQQMPVDVLKIDRSFVSGVSRRDDLRALVRTVLDLAASYHLDVVAEGIEEPDDVAMLLSLGCKVGQGFGLGMPMGFEDLVDLVATGPSVEAA